MSFLCCKVRIVGQVVRWALKSALESTILDVKSIRRPARSTEWFEVMSILQGMAMTFLQN